MPRGQPENLPSIRGRIGAHVLHSKYDSKELTAPARAAATTALNERLLQEIDPANELPDAERLRRLEHARKAYFSRLALLSARKRQRRK